ncbi:MAG: site-specific integrase [Oscillospiraceae bacterium]|nr:site-specific integrase [Oscillospiraceae bacterium]
MGNLTGTDLPEQDQRYAVYSVRNTVEDSLIYTRSFIVIKNGYGVIVRFTRFQEYAGVYERGTYRPITSNPEAKLYLICGMLNYCLVDHGARFGIRHVFGITKEMLAEYFDQYAMERLPDGSHRSRQSVERCISAVAAFMAKLAAKYGGYMKVRKADLYTEKTVASRRGKLLKRKVPAFQATGIEDHDGTFRDIPTKAVEILLPMAFRYARDIAFGLCLQAFAGLRAGEVCNVRQETSPLGPGIRFVEMDGCVRGIEIDLRRELALRSDGAEVGEIKKERIQPVYPAFRGAFCRAYELHKEYLGGLEFEKEYAPMFVNSKGMALSYESYRKKFKSLINDHLRPALLASEDPELRIYGQLLCENSLGTHCLRHWFTVQLVLRGEDIGNIQYFRGDKNPETAFLYLQNKGDLNRELEESNEKLVRLLMAVGGDRYGK